LVLERLDHFKSYIHIFFSYFKILSQIVKKTRGFPFFNVKFTNMCIWFTFFKSYLVYGDCKNNVFQFVTVLMGRF